MARNELAALVAEIAALREEIGTLKAARAATSEASQHYAAKDLPCPAKGAECKRPDGTVRMFRSQDGIDSHLANFASRKSHDSSK